MTDIPKINSNTYWNTRFVENWESFQGPAQSRFFARIAIEHLPSWLINQLKLKSLSFADWGCAQGDGTDVLANYVDHKQLTGVDFSAAAIEQAAIRYPSLRFINEDWLEENGSNRKDFDIVFSSNTLEHFHDPFDALHYLCERAKKAVVLALPYRELERIDEHFFSFYPDNIPTVLPNGFRLIWSQVVDCRALTNTLWMGEQIILVFADATWVDKQKLTLADVDIKKDPAALGVDQLGPILASRDAAMVDRDAAVADRDAAMVDRDSAVAERDLAVAERNAAETDRDAAGELVSHIKNSNSWRVTRPLRFFARWVRYGLANEDRQRLGQGLRNRYRRLPLPTRVKRLVSFIRHRVFAQALRLPHLVALGKPYFDVPKIKSAANAMELPDYVVWGVIDWHFRHQRPQQLALALTGTGRRVFYVSSNLVQDARSGFEVEALDAAGLLFQIKLFVKGACAIYSAGPPPEMVSQLRASIGEVLQWADCRQLVSMVQHPFWCDVASVLPNSQLVYDCMDHHEGFGNVGATLLQLEKALLLKSDLTVTSSAWLDQSVAGLTKNRTLVRNAAAYAFFARAPESVYRDPKGRRIIGYYGAIAEWFDLGLAEAVARRHPECCVLLVGADSVNAKSSLGKLPNVTFIGEVPYSELPHYLYGFDVCLLPFKVVPLTMATNPVKAYEYLSAGKPVVSVDLPEMAQFDGLLYVAADQAQFLAAIEQVLAQPEPEDLILRRKEFAQGQTWIHRAEVLIQHAESTARDPKVSVIVVTYNNIELTGACLKSLDEYSQYEYLELIVVDNASSDGTPKFLSEWVANGQNRRLILNDENRGFAAANNQGLAVANGEYLVLLNNDTYVTPGWIRTLVRHLQRDKTIGLIGPVTNNIGNEAKIDIAYDGMDEMRLKSAAYTRRHIGQTHPLKTAAFFCVMMPRATYERVGTLDEAFGRGFFEDDDYCRRVEQIGLSIACAEDVFIHHYLSASFNKLRSADRQALFEQNKATYEAKWGKWAPHTHKKVATK